VLSHERLTGNPHSGFYDWAVVANRIAIAAPNARVVIAIREQRSMIVSTYKQYVRIGGTQSLEQYLRPINDYRLPRFDWRVLRYVEVVSLYKSLFKDVLVLPVETLGSGGMEGLWRFLDVDPAPAISERINEGIPDEDIDGTRRRNLGVLDGSSLHDLRGIRPRALHRLLWLEPNRLPLAEETSRILGDAFSSSNAELSRIAGIDLAALGYQTPG